MLNAKRCLRIASVAALNVVASTMAQLPKAPANLDFETLTGDRAAQWGGGGGENYVLSVDAAVRHAGARSGRISFVGQGEPAYQDFASYTQGVAPDNYLGQRIRYSGWLRTEGVEGAGVSLWMRVDGPNNKSLAFDNMEERAVLGTTPWTKYEVVLDVANDAKAIYFGALIAGKGTMWVDGLVVEPAPPGTPTTDMFGTRSRVAQNLDFEASTPGGRAKDWGGGGIDYDMKTDTVAAHGGRQSGRITYTGKAEPNAQSFGTFTQGIGPAPYAGKRVRLTGFLRTDNVAGWTGLWMRVDGEGDFPLAFDNMQTRAPSGTTPWTRYEVVLDVAAEAKAIFFGALLAGSGTMWVDDLKLEVVPGTTPTTDTMQSAGER